MLGIILASHDGIAEGIRELGEICLDNVSHWKNFNYTIEQNEQIIELITKQIDYLDRLPSFELTEEEKKYIERISTPYDMKTLKDVNQAKIDGIENPEKWMKDNEDLISQYEGYKNSEEYQNSMMKQIQDKMKIFMKENEYYEIAIPVIENLAKAMMNTIRSC